MITSVIKTQHILHYRFICLSFQHVTVMRLVHVTTFVMSRMASVPVSKMWLVELVISVVTDTGDSHSVVHASVMEMLIHVIHLLARVSVVRTLLLAVPARG